VVNFERLNRDIVFASVDTYKNSGMHAASVLAQRLPPSHRVILVERNSHFNRECCYHCHFESVCRILTYLCPSDLYVFPRFSTLPGHEHKAFIPYASIFKDAPKRPAKGPLSSKNSSKQAGPKAPFTPSSQIPPSESRNKEMLGMGAMAGKDEKMLQSGPSSSSDTSEGSQSSIFRPRRRLNSSGSQSSSGGDDSVFDKDSLRSIRTAATSLSSSYVESSSSGVHRRTLAEKEKAAGSDASHYAMEDAIAAEALSGKAREEEDLGRPEIQVEDLDSALKKGIDLEGEVDDAEDVAHGFEDSSPHVVLQATVTNITSTHVIVQSNNAAAAQVTGAKKKLWSVDSVSIPYSHLVYALGSHLPDPLRTEARTKRDGISWMRDIQNRVKASQEIVLVGGGALGVEFASDIKSVHPEKKVTLIHSRMQLLPNFDKGVHDVALQTLQGLGVNVVLGERLALTEGCPRGSTVEERQSQSAVCTPGDAKGEGSQAHKEGICIGDGRKKVKTTGGKEFECDLLLLCTGQQPNSSLMAQLSPTSVDSRTRLVKVLRTLQVQIPTGKDGMAPQPFDPTPPCGDCDCFLDKKAAGTGEEGQAEAEAGGVQGCLGNVYAIGDVADAFGALNAGYQAWNMADVAAENIIRDIGQDAESSSATTCSS
jgi:NADH dehydrogenase FAD-containing subunit